MRPQVGVALGGGAARGLAHLGVLDALRQAGIPVDVVAGTSFGALVGAAVFSRRGDARQVEAAVVARVESESFQRSKLHFLRHQQEGQKAATYSVRDAIRRGLSHGWAPVPAEIMPPGEFEAGIDALVPDGVIESLPVRFGAVAADLASGEEILFDRGSLRVAVKASCAIPGMLPPRRVAGRPCVDGGWVAKVPVRAARALGAEFVIAVDVADELADTAGLLEGPEILHRADAVQAHRLKEGELAHASVVVRCDVAAFGWADFARARDIAEEGRRAAVEALPQIREHLLHAGSWIHRARLRLRDLAGATPHREGIDIVRLAATEGESPR